MNETNAPTSLVRNDEASRHEMRIGDTVVAVVDFHRDENREGVVELPHTGTHPEYRGRGYAAAVVDSALRDLQDSGLRVRLTCPFVVSYIEANPAFGSVVVDS